MLDQKGNMKVILVVLVIFFLLMAGFYFLVFQKNTPEINIPKQPAPKKTSRPSPKVTPPESDPYSNWQTYKDTLYKFSIKYPPNWKQSLDKSDYDNSNYHLNFSEPKHFGDLIEIRFLPNPKGLNAYDYFKNEAFKKDLPGWDNYQRPVKNANLAYMDAIKIDGFTGGSGDRGPTVFISKDSMIIEVITQNNTKSGSMIFEQMLETFEFTDN